MKFKVNAILMIFMLTLLNACGGGDNKAEEKVTLSIAAASIVEGDAGTSDLLFTITLSTATDKDVTVNYKTKNATALAGSDYVAVTSATLTIAAGTTTSTVNVLVLGDAAVEADETLTMILSAPVNATIATAFAIGTITNDDIPSISIAPASVLEGNAGINNLALVVSLSAVSAQDITVSYTTVDGTAVAGSDYTAIPATVLTIPAGTSTATINVSVLGDVTVEQDESLTITLSTPVNATIATASAIGTITNDDLAPATLTWDQTNWDQVNWQ